MLTASSEISLLALVKGPMKCQGAEQVWLPSFQ